MNKQELKQLISATDYAGTTVSKEFKKGFREGMKISADMLEQLDEPQKPVVPKFVAEWIEYAKKKGDSLAISFKPWNLYGVEYSKADRWIEDNQETFARAWIDGYEVEKEPLYYVRLPYEVWDEEAAELKTEYLYLHYEITSDETRIFPTKEPRRGFSTKLDEITIKSVDERYWPFAVPVEEVAER
nr:DUF1642 domain-containing protein [Enterococcus lactis]